MVEIRLLQAAVAVAEERSVTRAAERLGLTQPALSKQLAELEERVGFVLFERSSQRFDITDAGAAFVEHARIALAEIEKAIHSARSASLGAGHLICVAKSPYIDPYFISMMRTIRLPLYPKLELRFSSHFSHEALRMLRSGEADVAVTCSLTDQTGISSIKLAEEPFFVAFPTSDTLQELHEVRLADLHQRRWALFERHVNPSVYDKLQQLLADGGVHASEIQHVQQAEEAAALIMQRGSVALLTKAGAWRISDDVIAVRPLMDHRLILKTFLSARLDEESRLVADFTRALMKKLASKPEQTKLAWAS